MRSGDGDEDAGFANIQVAEAVNDGEAMDSELFADELADFFHLGEGHRFVGLVLEIQRGTPMGFVADEAVEGNDCAVLAGTNVADHLRHIDGRVDQREVIVLSGNVGRWQVSAPANWWKKRDSIIVGEDRIPGSKLLVSGSHDRGAKSCQVRVTGRVTVEKIRERCAVGDFRGFLGHSGELPYPPEEEHFDTKIG